MKYLLPILALFWSSCQFSPATRNPSAHELSNFAYYQQLYIREMRFQWSSRNADTIETLQINYTEIRSPEEKLNALEVPHRLETHRLETIAGLPVHMKGQLRLQAPIALLNFTEGERRTQWNIPIDPKWVDAPPELPLDDIKKLGDMMTPYLTKLFANRFREELGPHGQDLEIQVAKLQIQSAEIRPRGAGFELIFPKATIVEFVFKQKSPEE